MKRYALMLLAVVAAVGFSGSIMAAGEPQSAVAQPAPTLVPPTLVPFPDPGDAEVLPSESTVSRILRDGRLRVGILYNAQPFGVLNIRGEVTGYDADVARSLAAAWGIEAENVEFVQVTRQTRRAVEMLRNGDVDMLVSALVHRRELDAVLEFSQPYYIGRQAMMVRADDAAASLGDLAGRRVGVVIASVGESALRAWMQRSGSSLTVETFLTLDRAYVALADGRVDGVVDQDVRLLQVAENQPDLIRLIDEPVEIEPHAIAVIRQDVNFRNLIDRTLQHLAISGRMDEIHRFYFPGTLYSAIIPWINLGDTAPDPAQYAGSLTFPAQNAAPRILSERVVRVAGLLGVTADAEVPESERRMDALSRNLLEQMSARWGVTVEFISNSAANALELVANGQADIAVGISPDWNWADRVDFTGPYLLRGERMLVRTDGQILNFSGLRGGRVVATPVNEPSAAARAVEEAGRVNALIEVLQAREQDLAFVLLDERDADVAFGDSLRLIPHVQRFPDRLRLTTAQDRETTSPWYSLSYVAMAVPRNDITFRLLVEYTLQELMRDGTLTQLLQPVMLPEDIPQFVIWPGSSQYLGLNLGG